MGGAGIKFDTYLTLLMSLSSQPPALRIWLRQNFFSFAFLPGIGTVYFCSGGSQGSPELADGPPSELMIGTCADDPCAGFSRCFLAGGIRRPKRSYKIVSDDENEVYVLAELSRLGELERVWHTCKGKPCAGVCPCAGVGAGRGDGKCPCAGVCPCASVCPCAGAC